jgi:hypothetical protein
LKRLFISYALRLAIGLVVGQGFAHAQSPWPSPEEVRAMAVDAAERYDAPVGQLLALVYCETGGSFDVGRIGGHGERGAGQWLPGVGNAWRLTSYARQGIEIVDLYRAGDPSAPYIDLDGLAQVFAYHHGRIPHEWYYCSRQ